MSAAEAVLCMSLLTLSGAFLAYWIGRWEEEARWKASRRRRRERELRRAEFED